MQIVLKDIWYIDIYALLNIVKTLNWQANMRERESETVF